MTRSKNSKKGTSQSNSMNKKRYKYCGCKTCLNKRMSSHTHKQKLKQDIMNDQLLT